MWAKNIVLESKIKRNLQVCIPYQQLILKIQVWWENYSIIARVWLMYGDDSLLITYDSLTVFVILRLFDK